jgi:hypothetical protein
MDVIGLQVTSQHSAFLLPGQAMQHFTKVLAELAIEHFSMAFWYPNYMKLAFPFGVA